ncbi:lipase family protein [Amycolatopsis cihanbeyliensis]|uniref:Secretory lipase n=1 Tax=Amycolatopsis cihanbeyliensis TaxID=1128664 RepID=A0A542DE92_AMYCI|nr:lipase family protein [Amycolatopsis cihanbeyliensis]TQJ01383.1 secretory lipase [Amycolatopsis cihanbeyliensis]
MNRSRLLTALVLAVVLTAGAPVSAAPPQPAPPGDAFYQPPSPLPDGQPGEVIRWRPGTAGPAHETVDAWQVMYHSTDALGEPNVVTGTVLLGKDVDPATAPVVAMAPGTHGPAFRCAPSKMLSIGAFYEQPALEDLLGRGYAVAMTDYEGYHPEPDTTYVTGRAMGHAVIDVVRAAQRLPVAGLSAEAEVAFRGYSQGGGAAMWAGQMQPGYAPELNLVGVAAGGVPADLAQVSIQLDGGLGFGLLAYALQGLDAAYPRLRLDSYLNEAGRTEFARMRQEACTFELLVDYRGRKLSEFTTASPVIQPEWMARIRENVLGGTPIEVPVFDYHATGDDLVWFPQAERLRRSYCDQGVPVTWRAYDTDHITLVYTGNEAAHQFIADRFAGKPVTSNC